MKRVSVWTKNGKVTIYPYVSEVEVVSSGNNDILMVGYYDESNQVISDSYPMSEVMRYRVGPIRQAASEEERVNESADL